VARADAIKGLIEDFDGAFPGHQNTELLLNYFNSLNDDQFEQILSLMESGDFIIPLVAPNLADFKLDQQTILNYADQIGHNFFERIWMADPNDPTKTYLTPNKYLVVDLVMRRQAQTIDHKMSVPKDDSIIDDLTGQSTGESKGSSVTFPELQLLSSYGLDNSVIELIKVRGGDNESYRVMEQQIVETGTAELNVAISTGTRPKTITTLSTLLKTAHLGNNA
jgi:hypothetical protein